MTAMDSFAGLRGGNWGSDCSPYFLSSSNCDSAPVVRVQRHRLSSRKSGKQPLIRPRDRSE